MAEDMEKRVAQYVQVRDALDALKKRQEEDRKPLQAILDQLAGVIQNFLDTNNLKNLSTHAGSCYISTRYTASVADPDAFMRHVISTGNYDLLERRAKVEAVKEYVEKNGTLPTGVNLNALTSVGVRRAAGS